MAENKKVLVVGGGMSGLTAAIEAAEAGLEAYIVEKNPYLGGRVAQINKYFWKLCPPNCGLEIQFKRIKNSPRVTMYTLAEIIERLSQSMQDHEASVIGKSEFADLSVTQIHYLDAISHLETPTMSALAMVLGVTKPTATVALERLEKHGFIVKVASPEDRRVSYIQLTAKGLKIADLHDRIHQGYAKHFELALPKQELIRLTELLNKVIMHLGL